MADAAPPIRGLLETVAQASLAATGKVLDSSTISVEPELVAAD